jgi:RHS repeat-associated protein
VAGSSALAASSPVCGFNDLAIMPDGDVVATDQGRIVRIDAATGTIAQLNLGAGAFTPDGALIASATLETPSAIASDATGRIFFSDCGSHPLVRMIDEAGHLSTVAGSGASGSTLVRTKVDARSIALSCVPAGALEVDNRGNVFFAVEGGNRAVVQVDSAGQAVMLGGYDDCLSPGCSGHPSGLELDRKGNIYVAQRGEASVFRYTPGDTRGWNFGAQDESSEQVYGNPGELMDPRCNRPAGTSATAFFVGTRSDATLGIAISADGSLYVADTCQVFTSPGHESAGTNVGYVRTRRLDPAAARFVSSPDGARYYVFDGRGRHLETHDASTNGLVYRFNYDSAGRLAQIVDSDGNTTAIQRDGSGTLTAIVAPFGQETALHINANGYLDSIRPDPSIPAYAMQYVDARGLLQSFTTPRGTTNRFGYDALGVLASTTDAVDVTRTLAQSTGASVRTSTETGPSGTVTVAQQRGDDGKEVRVATNTDGTATRLNTHTAPQVTVVLSDGTTIARTHGEDPRWGTATPAVSATVSVPSGLRRESATYRTADQAASDDPRTATLVHEQTVVNGATWNTTVDLTSHVRTTVSPEGRLTRVTTDGAGRPIRIEHGGRSPIDMTRDTHGRLESVASTDGASTRTTTYGYSSASGYLESVADGAGDSRYVTDAVGRVVQWKRPDGAVVSIDHDPHGNVIAITPPEKHAHAMSYTPADALEEYAPPAIGQSTAESTVYEYTPDKKLKKVLLPDGRFIQNGYGADGKLQTVTTPLGTSSYTYNPTTGGLRSITEPSGGTLSFGSDGQLPNMVVWGGQGHVRGWVSRTFDASFRLATLGVNGATIATFGRDADGLITSAGPMQIARDAQSGDVAGTTLGAVTTVEQTSARGELAGYGAAYQNASLYSEEILSRDAIGRITLRRETVQGASTEYAYDYDAAGRLSEVRIDGALASHYEYDANGNRLARSTATSTESCAYDAQDRLTNCGDTHYAYNAVGQLSRWTQSGSSATTTFDYDVMGNLRTATLPDGRAVEFEIDGRNRRVGKRVDGERQWGLLYQDQFAPVAQVDAHNAVASTFIYATRENVPDYMVKNGQTYRLMVDHIGSVRLVVNVATGMVAQRMDYDAFGRVIGDTNPGFQPFGFAGGVYDMDLSLVRFGARDYDPAIGRWTAKDPILFDGGQANLYVYVDNDPINRIDSSGLGLLDWAKNLYKLCKALFEEVKSSEKQGDALDAAKEAIDAEKNYNELLGRIVDNDPSNDPTDAELQAAEERRNNAYLNSQKQMGRNLPLW